MKTQLFVPKICKVGFNPRSDTYTGKLGYIIYSDGKTWRKETSWKSWIYTYNDEEQIAALKNEQYVANVKRYRTDFNRYFSHYSNLTNGNNNAWFQKYGNLTPEQYAEQHIGTFETFQPNLRNVTQDESFAPVIFKNEPISGFVLNKKVGGKKYDWNVRSTYIRVYDPRGWEFEISVRNLLYILENTNSIIGKGLEGNFIYAWEGKDLVLLPATAPEFDSIMRFTDLQSQKFSAKQLVPGLDYLTRKQEVWTYLGKHIYYEKQIEYRFGDNEVVSVKPKKKFWFKAENGRLITLSNVSCIAALISDVPNEKYPAYMDALEHNSYFSPIERKELVRIESVDELEEKFGTQTFYTRINENTYAISYYIYNTNHVVNTVRQTTSEGRYTTHIALTPEERQALGFTRNYSDQITLAELFSRFELYKKVTYLQNGKIEK